MKLKNFDQNHPVNSYTMLNFKEDVIYNNDFKVSKYVNGNKNIFKILNVENIEGVEFWEVKSVFDKQAVGWIIANNHIRLLNTVSQKIQVDIYNIDNTLNDNLSIEPEFYSDKFYTKKFITEYEGSLYFGLFDKAEFTGYVDINSLNLGEIDPIEFTFNDSSSFIYETADLKFPTRIDLKKKKLYANSYFLSEDKEVLGFTFGDRNFWVDIDDISITNESILFISYLDVDTFKNEYYINWAKAEETAYYSVNSRFNTTEKLLNIINNYTDTEPGSKIYKKFNFKIGIICDEFMYYSLKDSANIEYISFSEDLKVDTTFDLVLVVSSWRGVDESWQYVANPKGSKREVLNQLLEEYNSAGIPTVFYSKEDPVNYDRFISIAQHCKQIYTSAVEIIDQYKEDTGNDNVGYLQFSINPTYHNPIGKNLELPLNHKQVIFAGSWMKKYPVRNNETEQIFDGVLESKADLSIVDRNYNRHLSDYQFPYYYTPYISKTIDHENLMKLHKATSWGINLNSVKYSNTMFANRVYELQAMGNMILSNYSMGVNNKFPYISMVHGKEDVIATINATSQIDKLETIAKGISEVMLNHSAHHRINKILTNLGYNSSMKTHNVLVVGESIESQKSFNRQFYESKEFVLEENLSEENYLDKFDFITYFKDEITYEENYLSNLLSGFAYTNSDVVEMSKEQKYNYKKTSTFNKYISMIDINNFGNERLIFNIPETEIVQSEINTDEDGEEKTLSVIIPIHNNGKYLEDKCFRSLRRSSIFNQMEIIMIDDGSSDLDTIKIIDRLRRRYPDIVYYKYDEGSGSASRPRNRGIDMVRTKYVTFLDPDNEASGDGYKTLLDEMKDNDELDLVLGNVLKEDNIKKSLLNYHYYVLVNNEGEDIVKNPKEFLIKANLRAHSIQAMIIKTNVLQDNKLKMVEGAAGQDTMFFQELLLHSNTFKSVSDIIHIYYAAVEGSVTTTIKKSFFEKYLVLEKERVPFLKKHGLYDIYVNERFPYYYVNWYHKRLSSVKQSDYKDVIKILREIIDMYIHNYNFEDENFNLVLDDIFNIKIADKIKN